MKYKHKLEGATVQQQIAWVKRRIDELEQELKELKAYVPKEPKRKVKPKPKVPPKTIKREEAKSKAKGTPTKVYIIESESGWGQKVDEVKEFPTREDAIKFCKDYNTKYNPPMENTPDWYMYAKLDGEYGMLRWD